MMQISILTPFPNIVEAIVGESILRRAREKGLVDYHSIDLHDFAEGDYPQLDDYPFGGGSGMVMMAEPFFKAVDYVQGHFPGSGQMRVILPTPQGEILTQKKSREFSKAEGLIFICSHYKGIDERVREAVVTDEVSIGDYVVTGGELPAMVILDSVVRLVPGVLGDEESALSDSFANPLLDYPHYTRPETTRGMHVPEVLLSGHHKRIEVWRKKQREKRTRSRRPDLWKRYVEENSKGDG
ncbi:MAG: tRNA (guanosine(37)-N1)-methyltransferase TrmD [Candidatus Neomarinimicrobiota bacterium]